MNRRRPLRTTCCCYSCGDPVSSSSLLLVAFCPSMVSERHAAFNGIYLQPYKPELYIDTHVHPLDIFDCMVSKVVIQPECFDQILHVSEAGDLCGPPWSMRDPQEHPEPFSSSTAVLYGCLKPKWTYVVYTLQRILARGVLHTNPPQTRGVR